MVEEGNIRTREKNLKGLRAELCKETLLRIISGTPTVCPGQKKTFVDGEETKSDDSFGR